MNYTVNGAQVDLSLSAEEVGEVIEALEQVAPESEVLEAFQQFRREEFA